MPTINNPASISTFDQNTNASIKFEANYNAKSVLASAQPTAKGYINNVQADQKTKIYLGKSTLITPNQTHVDLNKIKQNIKSASRLNSDSQHLSVILKQFKTTRLTNDTIKAIEQNLPNFKTSKWSEVNSIASCGALPPSLRASANQQLQKLIPKMNIHRRQELEQIKSNTKLEAGTRQASENQLKMMFAAPIRQPQRTTDDFQPKNSILSDLLCFGTNLEF